MTVLDERQDEEEPDLAAPETRAAGRWNSAGVPTERSKDFGTAVKFVKTPSDAAKQALKEEKLVFVLHVSGDFEEPDFT